MFINVMFIGTTTSGEDTTLEKQEAATSSTSAVIDETYIAMENPGEAPSESTLYVVAYRESVMM